MSTMTIDGPRRALSTYVARPSETGPHPGVVVIHDAIGMTPDARHQADWLAREGFLAAVPDLFRGGSITRCLRAMIRDYTTWRGELFDDVEAVRAWLADQPGCSASIGVIGFCFGGGFALMLAPGHGFGASSANYGTIPRNAAQFFDGACPIVASYGAEDRSLRGASAKLDAALSQAGVEHDVKEYPGAGHGFMNDHGPGEVPALFVLAGRLLPTGYDEPSALDARRRVVEFFRTHLS